MKSVSNYLGRCSRFLVVGLSFAVFATGCSDTTDPPLDFPPDASVSDSLSSDGAPIDGSQVDAKEEAGIVIDSGPPPVGRQPVAIQQTCQVPKAMPYTMQSSIIYRSVGGMDLMMNIAVPDAAGTYPVVVAIHGGSFVSGSYDGMNGDAEFFAGQGYVGVSIGYRLIQFEGDNRSDIFPAQIEDARCAVRWLRKNAATYKIDPSRVATMGHSAGGNLALMLGAAGEITDGLGSDCGIAESATVLGAISLSGPADFRPWVSGSHGAYDLAMVSDTFDLDAFSINPTEYPTEAALISLGSPITHVDAKDPYFLLIHGTADDAVPYTDAQAMQAALTGASVPSTLITHQGGGHEYVALNDPAAPMDSVCTVLAFLQLIF